MTSQLVPDDVAKVIDEMIPGRDNASNRYQLRLVCSVISMWENHRKLALRGSTVEVNLAISRVEEMMLRKFPSKAEEKFSGILMAK